jgi:hypothetical protein
MVESGVSSPDRGLKSLNSLFFRWEKCRLYKAQRNREFQKANREFFRPIRGTFRVEQGTCPPAHFAIVAERPRRTLIGSIRRESLDHLIVCGEAHLRGVLKVYASYYDEVRTHLSLDKNSPDFRRPQKLGRSLPSQFWVGCITNMSGFRF